MAAYNFEIAGDIIDAAAGNNFGYAVGISGDYAIVGTFDDNNLTGAPYDDDNGEDSGSVYIFE